MDELGIFRSHQTNYQIPIGLENNPCEGFLDIQENVDDIQQDTETKKIAKDSRVYSFDIGEVDAFPNLELRASLDYVVNNKALIDL